ncbi:MAG: hypothetical protein NTU94_08880 [Planctomycetota bacterium]|nr:hypothetical protein [Planctomycetota bacterium]
MERRGNQAYVVDAEGQRAPVRIEGDFITPETEVNLRKLNPAQLDRMQSEIERTPYLSPEGKQERIALIEKIRSGAAAPTQAPAIKEEVRAETAEAETAAMGRPVAEPTAAEQPTEDRPVTGNLDPQDPVAAAEITERYRIWAKDYRAGKNLSDADLRAVTRARETTARESDEGILKIREADVSTPEGAATALNQAQGRTTSGLLGEREWAILAKAQEVMGKVRRAEMVSIPTGDPNVLLWVTPGDETKGRIIAANMAKQTGKRAKPPGFSKATRTSLPAPAKTPAAQLSALAGATSKQHDTIFIKGGTAQATDGERLWVVQGDFGVDGTYVVGKRGEVKAAAEYQTYPLDTMESALKNARTGTKADGPPLATDDAILLLRRARQAQVFADRDSPKVVVVRNPDGTLGLVACTGEVGTAEINIGEGFAVVGVVDPGLLAEQMAWHLRSGDRNVQVWYGAIGKASGFLTRGDSGKTEGILCGAGRPTDAAEILGNIVDMPGFAEYQANAAKEARGRIEAELRAGQKIEGTVTVGEPVFDTQGRFVGTRVQASGTGDAEIVIEPHSYLPGKIEEARRDYARANQPPAAEAPPAEAAPDEAARVEALTKSLKNTIEGGKAGMGPVILSDLAELGWHYFKTGFRTFATWGHKLVVELGRGVGQHLRAAWVHMLRLHRDEIGGLGRQAVQPQTPEEAAVARVAAKIAQVPSFWQRLGRVMSGDSGIKNRIMTAWQNRLHMVNVVARQMTGLTDPQRQMPPAFNFAGFAKVANLSAAAKAEAARSQGIRDVTGSIVRSKSLKEIAAPIADRMRTDPAALNDFYAFVYAQHALDVLRQGKNPGITEADARAVVDAFSNRPDFVESAKGLTGWYNAALDYYIDAGGLSPEAAAAMRAMYPHYISLARQMETTGEGGGAGAGHLGGAVRRLKGSERAILPPFETAVAYLDRMIDLGDKVRFFKMFTEAAEKYPGGEAWAERVKPRILVTGIDLRQLSKQLEGIGIDLGEADLDSVMTAFHARHFDDPAHHIFTIYRGGHPESWRIDPAVWDAVMALNKHPRLPKFIDATFGAAARMRRLGTTGLRPGFSLITNPLRDTATALLQGEHGANDVGNVVGGTIRGIVMDLTNGEIAKLWRAGGGEMPQPLGFDRFRMNRLIQETLANSISAHATNWAKHPLASTATYLRGAFSIPEAGPRIAQFERTLRAMGWEPGKPLSFEQYVQAQLEAANVTVDFREAGAIGMWVNSTNAFFNPNIQGPARMMSTIRRHPVRSIIRGIGTLTLPTLGLWWLYKDRDWYKRMPAWERGAYWHFEWGDNIIRIPRPFEWGYLFASLPEAACDWVYRSDPRAFTETAGQALKALAPDIVPTVFEPPAEVWANKSIFRGAPLVSESLQRLPPAEQWTPRESEIAKAAGRLLGVSPIYLQHFVREYTGGLSEDIVGGIEQPGRALGILPSKTTRPPEPADRPVIGRLFLRPTAVRTFDDLYTERDALAARAAAHKAGRGERLGPEDANRLKRMDIAAKALANYRKRVQKVIEADASDAAKRAELLRLHNKMIHFAELALRK